MSALSRGQCSGHQIKESRVSIPLEVRFLIFLNLNGTSLHRALQISWNDWNMLKKVVRLQTINLGAVARSEASIPEFDPHVWHILSWRLGHKKNSTAILPLPRFKKSSCQWLAKECALHTSKLLERLPRNSVVRATDRAQNDLKCV